jgi:hypothetical protein
MPDEFWTGVGVFITLPILLLASGAIIQFVIWVIA